MGKKVGHVACGGFHSAAILESGELYTWGGGEHGQVSYFFVFRLHLAYVFVMIHLLLLLLSLLLDTDAVIGLGATSVCCNTRRDINLPLPFSPFLCFFPSS